MNDNKNFYLFDFLKKNKLLILKLSAIIIPGIFYWATNEGIFEKKFSFNISVNSEVSSKKIESEKNPQIVEQLVQNSADNIFLANQKYDEATQLLNQNDYANAIKFFNQAIELNPNHSFAYHNRGLCYMNLENFSQALSDLNKAIEIESYNAQMYNTRGTLHNAMKNYNSAIEDFSKAIQINSNYSTAYSNRAMTYNSLKNFNQAISDCNEAIKINPNNADAYIHRAMAYGNSNNLKQTFDDVEKAIQLGEYFQNKKNLAVAYHVRGLCYQNFGDNQKAQEDFAMSRQLGYFPVPVQ